MDNYKPDIIDYIAYIYYMFFIYDYDFIANFNYILCSDFSVSKLKNFKL